MSNFIDELNKLRDQIIDELSKVDSFDFLQKLKNRYLARKGELTVLLKELKGLLLEEKKEAGRVANQVKQEVEEVFNKKEAEFSKSAISNQQSKIFYDVTLPGKDQGVGTLHPITQVRDELNDAFKFLGFETYDGPEVSSEGYVFDRMNFREDHPARESMDTYWIKGTEKKRGMEKFCLRPQVTGLSGRYMQTHEPPFKIVYPGRVFRAEATDAGHERCFYHYEALIVNKNISLSGGKILVDTILERVFAREVKTRMRIGFFPFVEPGFEIDILCLNCRGKGCSVCSDGWVELMPGGVPHPNVLKTGGIDPSKWQGFYINIGFDRLVMMKYGIDDVRLFHSGDLRFLRQF